MKTTITFRHMQASSALKDFVGERLERLERYAPKAMESHVVLSIERHLHTAELICSAKGIKAQGISSTDDMYTSIDDAVEKVEKTLRRHHDKKIRAKTHATRPAASFSE